MDPEMIRMAQEQMSRIPPDEFLRMQQQMMSNPDLIRMATDGMKNLKADDIRFAAEQMKHLRPEDMAEMSSRLAHASPEAIAAMRVQADAQRTYEFQGALTLKNQGNQLHRNGKFREAIEKYYRAKQNLSGMPTSEAASLRLACSLNLMSCYLKMGDFEKTVAEGTEVLERDANNLKALYRRGQAYKELGKLRLAFIDLSKAAKVSSDDETVKEALRQLKGQLESQGEVGEEDVCTPSTNGPVIEEISDEEAERLTAAIPDTDRCEQNQSPPQPAGTERQTPVLPDTTRFSETIDSFKQNPEMIRSMYSMMSNLNPEQIASMSGGQMTPDMAKLASDMVQQMSVEDMQRMFDMMSSFQKQGVVNTSGPSTSAPSLNRDFTPSRSVTELDQDSGMDFAQDSTRSNHVSGLNLPSISPEMQEQMRQRMKDPAMKQMMASMLQSMTPESMVTMGEQMGFKMSREDAERAQTAMANLSPDVLEKMMKWADRAQRVAEVARKGKNYLLGRSGLVLALLMLIIAVLLHWLGVIGG